MEVVLLEWATVVVVVLGASVTLFRIFCMKKRIIESSTPIIGGLFLGAFFQVLASVLFGL